MKVIILDMEIKYFLGGQIYFKVFFRGNIFFEVLASPSVYHRSPPLGDQVYVTSNDGDPIACQECAGFTGFLIKAYI